MIFRLRIEVSGFQDPCDCRDKILDQLTMTVGHCDARNPNDATVSHGYVKHLLGLVALYPLQYFSGARGENSGKYPVIIQQFWYNSNPI